MVKKVFNSQERAYGHTQLDNSKLDCFMRALT